MKIIGKRLQETANLQETAHHEGRIIFLRFILQKKISVFFPKMILQKYYQNVILKFFLKVIIQKQNMKVYPPKTCPKRECCTGKIPAKHLSLNYIHPEKLAKRISTKCKNMNLKKQNDNVMNFFRVREISLLSSLGLWTPKSPTCK